MTDVPPLPPPARMKTPGYLIVLYVVLGLVAFFLVTGSLAAWMFLRSETGQRVVTTFSKGMTLLQEASTAPGTAQLRALGCNGALVIPLDRAADILKQISPEAASSLESIPGHGTMVVCQIRTDEPAIGCAEVARTYANAVPSAPDQFGVTVQGRSKARCQGNYTRDGTLAPSPDTRLER